MTWRINLSNKFDNCLRTIYNRMKISGTRLKISFHASCFCIKHRRRYDCMTSFQRGTKIRDHRIYKLLLGAVSIHFEHYWLRYKNFLGKSLSKFDYKKFLQHNYSVKLFSRSTFRINVRSSYIFFIISGKKPWISELSTQSLNTIISLQKIEHFCERFLCIR